MLRTQICKTSQQKVARDEEKNEKATKQKNNFNGKHADMLEGVTLKK